MKHPLLLILALSAFLHPAFASGRLNGIVINAETKKPVVAAGVELIDERTGTYTDRNGQFSLSVKDYPVQVRVSHIGFATQILKCDSPKCEILLQPVVLNADEVLVTAYRAISGKSPVAFSTLEREDIDLLYRQQDVPMVLDMEPGIYAYSDAGDGSGYTYLNIRGFTQDRIGVMYNGVPLNDPEAHAVYWVDHGDILHSASDVQIQRGIGNSLSSAAFGGSVNVESSISKQETGFRASLGYGNYIDAYGLRAPQSKRSVSYTGKPFPVEGLAVSFRLSDLNSDGYRIGSGTDQKSGRVALEWMTPTHVTRAEYLHGNEVTLFSWDGISPQYGFDLKDPDDRRYNYYADTLMQGGYADVNQDVFTQSLIYLNHTHLLNEYLKFYGNIYHVRGEGYYQQFRSGASTEEHNLGALLDTVKTDLIRRKWLDNQYGGAIANLTLNRSRHTLHFGTDVRLYGSRHFGQVIYVEDHGYLSGSHRFYNNTTKKSSFSVYVQDLISLSERLFIQGDLRYLTHRFEVKQDSIGAFTTPAYFIVPYHFLDAHVGVRYYLTEHISSFMHVSSSKREPSSDDIYNDSDPYSTPAVADPYGGTVTDPLIRHESMVDLEWGFDYKKNGVQIMLNAYYMDFRNELIPVYYRYRDADNILRGNAPKTLHKGLEFSLRVPVDRLTVHANMSLADNHFVEFSADSLGWGGFGGIADYAGKKIPAFPSFQAKARLIYQHEYFQPWLNLRFIGKQYIDFMNTESAAIDPYFVADAGVRIPFSFLNMRHILDLRVSNLFNALYETFGYAYYNSPDDRIDNYWPAATRSFYLSWDLLFTGI
jgi:iron complex outermembrane receptor protein